MRKTPYKPQRRLKSELLPLAIVVSLPLALAAVFPYGVLVPSGRRPPAPSSDAPATCAIVNLTEAEERQALAAARSSWNVNADGVKRLRIELFEDLPDEPMGAVIDVDARSRPPAGGDIGYEPSLLPSSLQAPAPTVLEAVPGEARPAAFPKSDMLKLDLKGVVQ